jgi:hypothetical protein
MPEDCRIRWDSVAHNHVFLTIWIQRERHEALQSISIVGHVFSPMVKSVVENGMEAKIWGLVSVVRVMVAKRFWLHDLWLGAAASASGGDNTWEIHSQNLQGEYTRSGLNWLCLAMALLKILFLRARNFFWVKTYDLWSGW